MDITKFNEKFNKLDGNVYTFEEVVTPVDGVYEANLIHDNIEVNTINIYTGSRLTGDKINTYNISTPSLAPWKTHIRIFSDISPLYISYETVGDTVEADDINNVQDAINDTQKELNKETSRAEQAETLLQDNLNEEIDRAKKAESDEATRATNAESTLQKNIDAEVQRAEAKEKEIDIELANRYTKQETFTRDEVLEKIQNIIGSAPEALDTLKEIADALNNDADFAGTMTNELSKKLDKTGGTISNPNYKGQLTIKRDDSGDVYSEIVYANNDGILGSMGFNGSKDAIVTDYNNNHYKIYHEGNLPTASSINVYTKAECNEAFNYHCTIHKESKNNYPVCNFAHVEGSESYSDKVINLLVTQNFVEGKFGIVRIALRSENQNADSVNWAHGEVKWLVRSGFNVNDIQLAIHSEKGKWFADVFYHCNDVYASLIVKSLSNGRRTTTDQSWKLLYCNEPNDSDTTTNNTTNCYKTISECGDYTSILDSTDSGIVNSAINAVKDSNGNKINETYVKKGMTWNELEGI